MEKIWSKLVVALAALIAIAWIILVVTGHSPSNTADEVDKVRLEIIARLNSSELNSDEDSNFVYRKFSENYARQLEKQVKVSEKSKNPIQTAIFYRKPLLPIVVKTGVLIEDVTPDKQKASLPAREEIAVFNAPLSVTFVPGNEGNLIMCQLDSIDNDRHMIRLALEVWRQSRKPATEGNEPEPWSDWKLIHIENLNRDEPLATAFIKEKLPSEIETSKPDETKPETDTRPKVDISSGPGGGISGGPKRIIRRPAPGSGTIHRNLTGNRPGAAGTSPEADTSNNVDVQNVDASLLKYDFIYMDKDIAEKTEYRYRVRMVGMETSAEVRVDKKTGQPLRIQYTHEMFESKEAVGTAGVVYYSGGTESRPGVTPKNMQIAYSSYMKFDNRKNAIFKIRYWVKESSSWKEVSTKPIPPDGEVKAKANPRDPTSKDIVTGLIFKKITKKKGGTETYMDTILVKDPKTGVLQAKQVQKTRVVPSQDVAVLEDMETGQQVIIPKKSFDDKKLREKRAKALALVKENLRKKMEARKKKLEESKSAQRSQKLAKPDPTAHGGAPAGARSLAPPPMR